MATFIEIRTDAFAGNLDSISSGKLDYSGIRRPVRGFEIKEETYCVLKVLKANGDSIPLTDAGGEIAQQSGTKTGAGSKVTSTQSRTSLATTENYSNFFIQRVEESRQEKSQILETFGDSYIFFFGERPRLINVSGILMNTVDFNWRTEFWYNYENILRGTKLVEQNARLYLFYDDIVVEGYMLQATARDDSESPYHIPFSFTLFVTAHTYLSTIGDDNYPITHAVTLQPLLQSTDVLNSMSELKEMAQSTQEYISTTEAVRKAVRSTGGVTAATGAKIAATTKNLFQSALALGLQAQNLTFLSLVNRFFLNRQVRFPKGIAGADSYANPPASTIVPKPQRTEPLRSKIRHNVDEYVDGNYSAVNLDEDALAQRLAEQQFDSPYLLEKQALLDLAAMGADPVQHPGGSPFSTANCLTAVGGSATGGF